MLRLLLPEYTASVALRDRHFDLFVAEFRNTREIHGDTEMLESEMKLMIDAFKKSRDSLVLNRCSEQ